MIKILERKNERKKERKKERVNERKKKEMNVYNYD